MDCLVLLAWYSVVWLLIECLLSSESSFLQVVSGSAVEHSLELW